MKKEMEGGGKKNKKNTPRDSLGVSPRIKAVSRQQYAKNKMLYF